MIAEHGFITFDNDGKIIIDPAHEGEDEGIVHLISRNGFSNLFVLSDNVENLIEGHDEPDLLLSLPHNTAREKLDSNVLFKDVSLGKFILSSEPTAESYWRDWWTRNMFIPSLGREVLRVTIRCYESGGAWTSLIAQMPHGTFVFLENCKVGDGHLTYRELISPSSSLIGKKCYRLTDDMTPGNLRSIMYHCVYMMDVYSPPPTPSIKCSMPLSDIIVVMTD